MKKYKIAFLLSHPIQYYVPLFKKIAAHPGLEIMVYFCSPHGLEETFDSAFGLSYKWDIPLLDGYPSAFLKNYSPQPSPSRFFGLINPGIIRELYRGKYDALVVHGYSLATTWLAFLGCWLTRTPIFLRGESQLLNERPGWKKFAKKILLTPLFRTMAAFLAIGALNKEYYRHYGVSEEKIFLVPYAVDGEFFNEQCRKWAGRLSETRKAFGIKGGDTVIIYVGKIFGAKGPGALDLLKAYRLIRNKEKTKLIFIGDGKEKGILEEYVRVNKIPGVIFAGFKNQTELPRYYSIADILVLPSYSEQWGIVINESMYFGAAVIASDKVGAAYDLVKDGRNGFIYPAGNVEALREKIEALLTNSKLLLRMKKESQNIINDWNFDRCASGIISALDYLVKRDNAKV